MFYSRLFKSIAVFAMVLLVTILGGCTKENNDPNPSGDGIVGKWTLTIRYDDFWCTDTLTFKANGEFKAEYRDSEGETDGTWGTYTYEDSILSMDYGATSGPWVYRASISGNKLTLTDLENGDTNVYIRQ